MNSSAFYYKSKSSGLGFNFYDEIETNLDEIQSSPNRFPVSEYNFRKKINYNENFVRCLNWGVFL